MEPPALTPNDSAARPSFAAAHGGRIHVDSCHVWSDRLLVRGWAMGIDGSTPRHVAIQLDEKETVEARTGLVREDVWRAHPGLGNRTAGFDALFELPSGFFSDRITIAVIYQSADGATCRFTVEYDLSRSPRAATRLVDVSHPVQRARDDDAALPVSTGYR